MSKTLVITAIIMGITGFLLGKWAPSNDASVTKVNRIEQTLAEVSEDKWTTPYVCPMHAEIVSHEPGKCPICGMDLVMHEISETETTENYLPIVSIEPSVVHNLGVRTIIATMGDLHRSIETIGKITRVDPMARRTITPPIRGELLSIADKHDGDFITAGELLFTIKSDELYENEKSFQDAYQSGDRATANAMIPQLSKMGLTPEKLSRLQAGETPEIPVEVHAFEDGFIFTRRGFVGEKVHTGFTVFNVGGNYRVIEVTAEIFERQWGWVEQGQDAKMTVRGLPGTVFEGKVVRVEPPVGYTTRSLEVALKFKTDNPELSQSMFAHVSIEGQPRRNVLLVPTDSVIRTGDGDRVVVMRGKDHFQPVAVVAGEDADGMIEIRSGINEGDKVVASGQFLIDSESNLMAGFRRLGTPGASQHLPPPMEASHEHQHQVDEHRHEHSVKEEVVPMMQSPTMEGYQSVTYIPASSL